MIQVGYKVGGDVKVGEHVIPGKDRTRTRQDLNPTTPPRASEVLSLQGTASDACSHAQAVCSGSPSNFFKIASR